MIKYFSIFCCLLLSLSVFSQEQSTEKKTRKQLEEDMPLNVLTAGTGRSRDFADEGSKITALGFDYLRKLSYRWEIGIQLDIDLEKSTLDYEGIVACGIGAYSITQKWPLFAGFGIASEGDHKEGLFRLGTEYVFFFSKRQFLFIAPGFFTDFYKESQTNSIMIVVGINW